MERRGREDGEDGGGAMNSCKLCEGSGAHLFSSGDFIPASLSCPASSYFGAVRSSAAEILRVFIGMVHPISRAKEVACLVSEPLIIALDDAVDQTDKAMQVIKRLCHASPSLSFSLHECLYVYTRTIYTRIYAHAGMHTGPEHCQQSSVSSSPFFDPLSSLCLLYLPLFL